MDEPRGFTYATTGADYTALATQSARSLRAAVPDARIDLFSDQSDQDLNGPFDQIHTLGDDFLRPKFEALIRSRFERTICLDADTLIVADPSDAFDVLDRFDLAMAQDPYRNTDHATATWREPVPAAFPQFNSGVIASRRSDGTRALWQNVIDAMRAEDLRSDQAVVRTLVYASDLRVATLPPEYNLMGLRALNTMSGFTTAPRILHSPRLHATFKKGKTPVRTPRDLLGAPAARQLEALIAADRTLGGTPRKLRPLFEQGLLGFLHARLRLVRGRFHHR